MTFTVETSSQWEAHLAEHQGHLLQSWTWGELKRDFGWTPHRVQVDGAIAQILFRQLPLGLTIAYIPKGPIVDWTNTAQCQRILSAVHTASKQQRAVFLKIEPNLYQANERSDPSLGQAAAFLSRAGFEPADSIQPQSSIVIDISGDEDTILAAMKQKTRYNIRLATRKDVVIRQADANDLPIFYELSQVTAGRDGFGIHAPEYYQMAYDLFAPDRCALLLAEFNGEPLAALMVFKHGVDAYYFYGASSNTHRNLMATYLIQWAAIKWAKSQGCTRYDLWGIPSADPATLEAEFTQRSDGLWGVYRFKRGFGGDVVRSIGAFDYVYNPLLYKLYKLRRGVTDA